VLDAVAEGCVAVRSTGGPTELPVGGGAATELGEITLFRRLLRDMAPPRPSS